MSKPSPLSRSSSSESIVESSSHETPTVEEKSKSSPPPVMKTKTKKSAQREAFIASSSTSLSSTYSEKNHDIRKSFKTEIDTARELNAKKQQWAEFSKKISPGGFLTLYESDSEEIQDLANWLSTSASAKVTGLGLSCEDDPFREKDYKAAKALAKVIQTNTSITELAFIDGCIDNKTVKCFAEAIQANPKTKIKILNFSNNFITKEGAEALAKMLRTNTTITKLNLQYNDIGAEGEKALIQALNDNPNGENMIVTV
jgi:Leucine Rich repeat